MKHLKGLGKRYFSLAIIAMYSTIHKLCNIDIKFQYHIKAFEYDRKNNSPPLVLLQQSY